MDQEAARELQRIAGVLARDAAAVSRRPLPPLLFFTDPARTPRPWETAERMPPGSAVVYRHFGAPHARAVAERLRYVAHQRDVLLLIGQDVGLAEEVAADGVHLPECDLARAAALTMARPAWLVTGAVHSVQVLAKAASLDAAILSPVFSAGGASAARASLGVAAFTKAAAAARCPVYALGGINAANAGTLIGSGACGIAAVDSIQQAFGPNL